MYESRRSYFGVLAGLENAGAESITRPSSSTTGNARRVSGVVRGPGPVVRCRPEARGAVPPGPASRGRREAGTRLPARPDPYSPGNCDNVSILLFPDFLAVPGRISAV